MTEREIFLSALEIEDTAERATHLEEACGGDADLLARIEALLASHESRSQFLNTPVVEQMSGEPTLADDATQLSGSTRNGASLPYNGPATLLEDYDMSDEIPLGYLEPSSKEGSLGRLAHYEIEEVLGRGAFGTVLKAFDEKLHRVVAIKVLAPEMAATSPARKRFLREARASAQIRHENVVAIHGVEEEPIPYLVMEYIPGQTLQQRLDQHGPLDVKDVLRLGKQIADGLAAAHAQGLIHRDIKPGNILLDTSIADRVKITDFGLARTADDASMTQSGMIAGTPLYMAPEQALGHKIDQRADLFSFGSVLYQMLSGRPPFRAPNTMAVLKRVTEDTPRPIREVIPEVPEWMCEIIGHLHAKDPDQRYASATQVSELLAKCLADLEADHKPKIPAPSQQEEEAAVSVRKPATKGAFARPLAKVAAAVVLLFTVLAITEATEVTQLRPTIVKFFTPHGTLVIETTDPEVQISIDGEAVTIRGAGVEELSLRPGEYDVVALKDGQTLTHELVTIERGGRQVVKVGLESRPTGPAPVITTSGDGWHGWPADAPPPAIAPFDAGQAAQHQQAWADYLGVPVEYENSIGMKFRLVPPGEFLMGGTPEEIERAFSWANNEQWKQEILSEAPQHVVILTQPVYVGVTEVTQAQYEQVMGTNPSDFSAGGEGRDQVAELDTSDHPVEMVSWYDALEFLTKLSRQEKLTLFDRDSGEMVAALEGTGYRLPTEAEWEYACRAGTTTWYWNTSKHDELAQAAWRVGNSGDRTHTVGVLRANPFGLWDVHGNVAEWTQDSWNPAFYQDFAGSPVENPVSPISDGAERVIRGGHWQSWYPVLCRSAHRTYTEASHRDARIGFRVVLPVDAVKQRPDAPAAMRQFKGEWIDVISLIDPQLDRFPHPLAGENKWTIENDELLVGWDDAKAHKLIFPLDSDWREYECEIEVTCLLGDSGFCLNLPSGKGDLPVLFDMTANHVTRIGSGAKAYRSSGSPVVDLHNKTRLRVRVEQKDGQDEISVWSNDDLVGSWSGDRNEIANDVAEGYPQDRRIGLYTHPRDIRLVFHQIRIRTLNTDTVELKHLSPVNQEDQGPADAPPPAVAPFDAEQAAQHQQAWADYLGVPVEYENTIGMKFRLMPPGEFMMGSTPEEIEAALAMAGEAERWQERIKSEAPQHKVILTQPVYVGVTEVTQAQYEQVMGTNPSHLSATGEEKEAVANLETGNHPVGGVSWNDAVEFCAKLSQQEDQKPFYLRSGEEVTPLDGTGYRLPTEAEWESACRGGTTTEFWSGDEDQDLIQAGWVASNSGGRAHAVGLLKANPFGLSDVHGNLWEWVQDSWAPAFYGKFKEDAAVNSSSPFPAGSSRVLRGGDWNCIPSGCRSSHRNAGPPSTRDARIGFRVTLPVDAVKQQLSADPAIANETARQNDDEKTADAVATESATPEDDSPTDQ